MKERNTIISSYSKIFMESSFLVSVKYNLKSISPDISFEGVEGQLQIYHLR